MLFLLIFLLIVGISVMLDYALIACGHEFGKPHIGTLIKPFLVLLNAFVLFDYQTPEVFWHCVLAQLVLFRWISDAMIHLIIQKHIIQITGYHPFYNKLISSRYRSGMNLVTDSIVVVWGCWIYIV